MNINIHALLQVLVMAAVIAFTRFLPFLAFPEGRKRPRVITYLGSVLPYAIIGMLVVYCFKGVSVVSCPYGLPELSWNARLAAQHSYKRVRRRGGLHGACTIGFLKRELYEYN